MDYKYYIKPSRRQKLILKIFSPLNWLFRQLGIHVEVVPQVENREMISLEQRMNMFHLISEVIAHKIPGDFVEMGCHTGNSSIQIQMMIKEAKSEKVFHVYDKFNITDNVFKNIKNIFIENFEQAKLPCPIIHEGLFYDTVPSQLPQKISFAHIDMGEGGNQVILMDLILFLLEHIYERMPKNSICLLMDYYDLEKTKGGSNPNPGVKAACDIFFEDKSEKVSVLYGNRFSHGYFRKS